MADQRDDGGPAFPADLRAVSVHTAGMTLRDYFAAHAPQPAIENLLGATNDRAKAMRELAIWAYDYADTMLAMRKT